jgi:signal transduction histidine kinase
MTPRARRTSIRTRLTAMYAVLFFLAGLLLVLACFLLVRHTLVIAHRTLADSPLFTVANKVLEDQPMLRDDDGRLITVAEFRAEVIAEQQRLHDEALRALLVQSLVAAGCVGVLAAGAGWLMAGRALRPLHRITATARTVAERSLDERIHLDGPQDELKQLADTFDAMLERLDRAFDGQRRFVANASHELRTPLTVSRTLIQVALARPDASEDLRTLGQALLEVNTQQRDLTDGLLALARSENMLAEVTDVDLAEVVGRVLQHAAPEAASAGIVLRAARTPATVPGDRVLLELLVRNLVQNGIRYNRAPGWVAVEIGRAGHDVTIRVSNTGPVVPAAALESIFEPFRRLGDERTGRGAGLGLSIVRSVAAAHHGRLSATPRRGGGLVVELTLPAYRVVSATSAADMPALRTTPPPSTSTAG